MTHAKSLKIHYFIDWEDPHTQTAFVSFNLHITLSRNIFGAACDAFNSTNH